MTSQPTRHYHVDPARFADLDNGWRAAVCIDADGAETLWLASPTPDAKAGCACAACAPHEQPGQPLVSGPTTRRSRSSETEAGTP